MCPRGTCQPPSPRLSAERSRLSPSTKTLPGCHHLERPLPRSEAQPAALQHVVARHARRPPRLPAGLAAPPRPPPPGRQERPLRDRLAVAAADRRSRPRRPLLAATAYSPAACAAAARRSREHLLAQLDHVARHAHHPLHAASWPGSRGPSKTITSPRRGAPSVHQAQVREGQPQRVGRRLHQQDVARAAASAPWSSTGRGVLSTTRARTRSAASAATAAVSRTTRQAGAAAGPGAVPEPVQLLQRPREPLGLALGRRLDVVGAATPPRCAVLAQGAAVPAGQPPGVAGVPERLPPRSVELRGRRPHL